MFASVYWSYKLFSFEYQEYIDLQDVLEEVKASVGASESQGVLCGMVAGGQGDSKAKWMAQVLENAELKGNVAKQCLVLLDRLYDKTQEYMADDEFKLELLLPDDEQAVSERVMAISCWCQGFLYGLAVSGVDLSSKDLSDEATEVIKDFGEISKADTELDDSEENEQALFDIEEFVRMGVLLLAEIFRASGPEEAEH